MHCVKIKLRYCGIGQEAVVAFVKRCKECDGHKPLKSSDEVIPIVAHPAMERVQVRKYV